MQIDLLGEIRMTRGPRTIAAGDLRGRRSRLALALLVLERHRPLPRHEVAEVLWAGRPPASWPSSLREVICRVRRVMTTLQVTDAITTRDRCLRVNLPEDVVVDVEQVVTADVVSGVADATVMALLRSAAQPLLPGEEGEWVEGWRRRIGAGRRTLLERTASRLLSEGRLESAERMAGDLIDMDPLSEAGYRLSMESRRLRGDAHGALARFDEHRRLLAVELGLDPSPEMVALQHRVLARPTAVVPARAPECPRSRTWRPAPAHPDLVGRDDVMATVTESCRRPGGVAVVAGERGAGRTRILEEVARRVGSEDDGTVVLFGRCRGASRSTPISRALARVTGEDIQPDAHASQLVDACGGRRVALLLDDCQWMDRDTATEVEMLLELPADVAVVLAHGPAAPDAELIRLLGRLDRAHTSVVETLRPLTLPDLDRLRRGSGWTRSTADLARESGGNAALATALAFTNRDGRGRRRDVHTIVGGWLAELSPDARMLLRGHAVAVPGTAVGRIGEAIGITAPDRLIGACDELVRMRLLEAVGEGPVSLSFRHAAVRTAVRDEVGAVQRVQVEQALGQVDGLAVVPTPRQHPANRTPAPAA